MRTPPQLDPQWWHTGSLDGRPMREILAARDIGSVLRFLGARGWSRAALSAATGLSETRVRQIRGGGQRVESYEVLERIADGLRIPRGLMGLAYGDHDEAVAGTPSGDPGDDDPAAHNDFVGTLAALAVGSIPANLPRMLPHIPTTIDMPRLVTLQHVEMLREVSDRHRQFDADRGGGSCRDSAIAYLNWATGMLRARFADDGVERALKASLSDMLPSRWLGLPRPG